MKIQSTALFLFLSASLSTPLWARISESSRQQIDSILGTKGIYTPSEDTYRISFPRTDVKVRDSNRALSVFAGLASWAAMTSDPHHGGALLLAELSLFEDEVNPILSIALENDLEVTAIHNHFLFERPRVLFMNVSGLGEPPELAAKLRHIFDKIKAIRSAHPIPASQLEKGLLPAKSNITASVIDSILEAHGQTKDGMYEASMGMLGLVRGIPAGKQMGLRTRIAFEGTDESAVVEGEMVMIKSQIQDILRALLKAGIKIAAIDNPMIDAHPEFYFIHYWGEGRAVELARGVRAALGVTLR